MMRDTAPALVMIHGLLGPIDYFGPQSFLPEFELHTPSLPGYGLEPKNWNGQAPSLRSQAAWVAQYLRSRVARPAWLLGHSVGGAIAMLAAGLVPELVKGIVNVEGNFTLNDAFWCRKIAAMSDEAWAAEYRRMQADPTAWLEGAGIAGVGRAPVMGATDPAASIGSDRIGHGTGGRLGNGGRRLPRERAAPSWKAARPCIARRSQVRLGLGCPGMGEEGSCQQHRDPGNRPHDDAGGTSAVL